MKAILLENGGLLTKTTKAWLDTFNIEYKEINPEVKEYRKENDLYFFAMLIDPELEIIFTSSAFETNMGYHASKYFNREWNGNDDDFKQIEYFAWLIRTAVGFRERNGLKPLTFHINYHYPDFLQALKENRMGKDTTTYLKLMLRQDEGHVVLNIYHDYEFQYTLKTEEDLKLN